MAHEMSQQICLAVTITKGEFYAYTIKKNQENNVTKHLVNDTGSLTGVWHEKKYRKNDYNETKLKWIQL